MLLPGESQKINENHCPYCGCKLNAVRQIAGKNQPKPGSAAICIQCGQVAIFDTDFSLRKPLPEEESLIQQNETIRDAQRQIFEAHVFIDSRKKFFH